MLGTAQVSAVAHLILLGPMEDASIRRLKCGAFRYTCSRG